MCVGYLPPCKYELCVNMLGMLENKSLYTDSFDFALQATAVEKYAQQLALLTSGCMQKLTEKWVWTFVKAHSIHKL